MTKEQMMKKVFDTFIAKYGKLNPVDALVVYDYTKKEISEMADMNDYEANAIADEAYSRINPQVNYRSLFDIIPDWFGGGKSDKGENCCKKNQDKMEKNDNAPAPEKKQGECTCKQNRKYVSETDDAKTIKYLMPGVEKKDITIELVGDEVRVTLDAVNLDSPFTPKNFNDIIVVGDNMDIEQMSASLKLGILTITIPKVVKKVEPKTIKIS